MSSLFPFQRTGRDFLSTRTGALLADQPGLGKTAQAITAADDTGAQRIVVLCPASLKTNWIREIGKFSALGGETYKPGTRERFTPARWTIVNYDIARLPALSQQIARMRPDIVICDEMHRLKGGPDSGIGRAFYDVIAPSAGALWGLSGTPAPNHLGELFWWIEQTCPQQFGDVLDYYKFLSRYTAYRDAPYGPRPTRNKNTIEFRDRIKQAFLRRLVREVMPELPPLQIVQLVLDADTAEARASLRALEQHPEYQELMSLRAAIAAGEAEFSANQYATVRRLVGLVKVGMYASLVEEELSADPDKKLVVMCWHREVIDALASLLAFAGLNPVVVHGGTSQKDRQTAVDTFQDATKCSRVFIGQIIAAGEGLTLTASNQVDILESSWVPKDVEQALRRVLRIGQTADKCIGRFVSLGGSIDEIVGAVLERKTRLLVQAFD